MAYQSVSINLQGFHLSTNPPFSFTAVDYAGFIFHIFSMEMKYVKLKYFLAITLMNSKEIVLSPLLFHIVIGALSQETDRICQRKSLYADDLVITDTTLDGLIDRLLPGKTIITLRDYRSI